MLFKIGFKNFVRSKGYYIAYAVSLAFFATLVYNVAVVEETLGGLFIDKGITFKSIDVDTIFNSIKIAINIIVLFFSLYVSQFFIKRRSQELALYKLFGMSRSKIWQLLLIENSFVVLTAIIIGIIAGIFTSRLIAMLSFSLLSIPIGTTSFALSLSAVGMMRLTQAMMMVFVLISLLPLRTIRSANVSELFVAAKQKDGVKKFPYISFVIGLFLLASFLYLMVIDQGVMASLAQSLDGNMLLLFYVVFPLLTVIFLYRGIILGGIFLIQKWEQTYKSVVLMLASNHIKANVKAVQKMLVLITLFSGVAAVFIMMVFGFMQAVLDLVGEQNASLVTVALTSEAQQRYEEELQSLETEFANLALQPLLVDTEAKQIPLMVISLSEFLQLQAKIELPAEQRELLIANSSNLRDESYFSINRSECHYPFQQGECDKLAALALTDMTDVVTGHLTEEEGYSWYRLGMTGMPITESRDVIDENKQLVATNEAQLVRAIFDNYRFVVVTDQQKEVLSVEQPSHAIYYNYTKAQTQTMDLFALNSIATSPVLSAGREISDQTDLLVMSTGLMDELATRLALGLIQVILFVATIAMIIALMMAVFFRTLENLEHSITDYRIARRIGMPLHKLAWSLIIEAFFTQLLPFYVGILGAYVLVFSLLQAAFGQMGELSIADLILTPHVMMMFAVLLILLHALFIGLVVSTYQKITMDEKIK